MSGKEKPEKAKKKFGARRVIRLLALLVFAGVFIYAAFNLGTYYYSSAKAQSKANELRSILEESERPPAAEPETPSEETPAPTPEPVYEVSERFKPLLELNPDTIGWIKIPGTNIDYPVLQTPEDPEYYLSHNFEGGYDNLGMPFLDGRCSVGPNSNHLIVYAHNIKSKIMFHHLLDFEDPEFWQENQYVYFDTLYEVIDYQIVAAYVFDVGGSRGLGFQFHRYVDMDEEEFEDFWENVQELAMYDTGIEVEYGDELLTLATCEYSTWNSRFVVLARRVK